MSPLDSSRAFARQADADLKAWQLYEEFPQALSHECHKLLFLQMACEKIFKAYQFDKDENRSHKFAVGLLRTMSIHVQQRGYFKSEGLVRDFLRDTGHLTRQIELLDPSMDDGGKRPDNCEYPWPQADGTWRSPLDYDFNPSHLLIKCSGYMFLKVLRNVIDEILHEA